MYTASQPGKRAEFDLAVLLGGWVSSPVESRGGPIWGREQRCVMDKARDVSGISGSPSKLGPNWAAVTDTLGSGKKPPAIQWVHERARADDVDYAFCGYDVVHPLPAPGRSDQQGVLLPPRRRREQRLPSRSREDQPHRAASKQSRCSLRGESVPISSDPAGSDGQK